MTTWAARRFTRPTTPSWRTLARRSGNNCFRSSGWSIFTARICNHCLNPACLAACPAGAIYKRGEDGIVLVSQDQCRAFRMCISGCPYKKVYYNWTTGKSENASCATTARDGPGARLLHACVGRIRYLGVLLYDADRLEETPRSPTSNWWIANVP